MTKKIALFALVAILTTASLKAQLSIEWGIGPQSNYQNISVFDKSRVTTHSFSGELALKYQFHDKFACGLEMLMGAYDIPATSESVGSTFVGVNFSRIRPLRITDDIIIYLYRDLSPGCTFFYDAFDFDGQSYKTNRYGFGVDYCVGLSIPIYEKWEIGAKCGLFGSFISKPKIDMDVPAKDYKTGEQMMIATRFALTLKLKMF